MKKTKNKRRELRITEILTWVLFFVAVLSPAFGVGQEIEKPKAEYINEVLMKNSTGQQKFLIKQDNISFVHIQWRNGFYSIGGLIEGKENGHWYLFDKKNRLRKDVFYSNGSINQIKEFDKKGKQVLKTNFTVDF